MSDLDECVHLPVLYRTELIAPQSGKSLSSSVASQYRRSKSRSCVRKPRRSSSKRQMFNMWIARSQCVDEGGEGRFWQMR